MRSRKLLSVESEKLRPATDRLRETMFDILSNMMDLEGAVALDLYAGTGSVGFETLSRGASKVVFVEADRKIADVLKRNAAELGVRNKCDIRLMKAETFLRMNEDKFDIAYVDPPYAINGSTDRIIDRMISDQIVKDSGVICVEHSKAYVPPPSITIRQKFFGSTILSFIKPVQVIV